MVSARRRRPASPQSPNPLTDRPARADALRRFAAEVSGRQDLDGLFRDVIDESFTLFGVDEAGLWTYDGSATPLKLAAQRGLSREVLEIIATLPRDAPTARHGGDARARRPGHARRSGPDGPRACRRSTATPGIRTICFVPIVFQRRAAGAPRPVPPQRLRLDGRRDGPRPRLRRPHGDRHQQRPAGQLDPDLAARLRVIAELAGRLSAPPGRAGDRAGDRRRGAPADRLRHDPRLPGRRTTPAGASRSPSRDRSTGAPEPDLASAPGPVGRGPHGLGRRARHSRSASATPRPTRAASRRRDAGPPGPPLLVPMIYERDRPRRPRRLEARPAIGSSPDDETTLTIFAGYAAHAIVNADELERLHRQQRGARAPARRPAPPPRGQRAAALDARPAGVLDLIADSLKAIVPYDSLTIYRVDRAAGVRRAVIARDRFAELILAYESPLGIGITGWVIDHGEAVLRQRRPPRSRGPSRCPGTPFEPEAMIVVPLLVDGEAIGTLNIGRMGEAEAHFTPERVRADQAVRRPGVDRAPERGDPRRGQGPRRAATR